MQDCSGCPPHCNYIVEMFKKQGVQLSGQSYQSLNSKDPTTWRRTDANRKDKVPQYCNIVKWSAEGPAAAAKRNKSEGKEPEHKRSRRGGYSPGPASDARPYRERGSSSSGYGRGRYPSASSSGVHGGASSSSSWHGSQWGTARDRSQHRG